MHMNPLCKKSLLSRRQLLAGASVGAWQLAASAQTSSKAAASPLAMPGPYRGRVVARGEPGRRSSPAATRRNR